MNKQTKWLVGLVAILVVINIVLVAFLWFKAEAKPAPPEAARDARNYLIKDLSLTDEQVKAFDSLRKGHFEKMRGYKDAMRQLKDSFFQQLSKPRNAQVDSIAQQIGALQTKIDLQTFEHFSALRVMLNKEQKEKFDNTIQDVLRTMAPREGPPPPRGRQGDGPAPDGPPPPPDDKHMGPPHQSS